MPIRLLLAFWFLLISLGVVAQTKKMYINEVMCCNKSTIHERLAGFTDWIEIYNPTDKTINMAGMFFSDDKKKPTKFRISTENSGFTSIPARQVRLFWFDLPNPATSNQISIALSNTDEYLSLYDVDTTLVDEIVLNNQRVDISYGRMPDGGSDLYYFKKPTPKKTNSKKGFKGLSPAVEFSEKGGFYKERIIVKLKSEPGVNIFYSLNGSAPTDSTGILYNSPITVDKTTVIRAVTSKPDFLSIDLHTESYFIDESYSLPIVSIATDDYSMFTSIDPMRNIYSEELANVEYYDMERAQQFNTCAGIRLVGKAIRNYPQKSIAIRFRSYYGLSKIKYKLFDDKEKSTYYSFILRNSGNDWSGTMLKDAFMHRLVNGTTHIDCQGYSPVIVYINGDYWGIHNLREKINKYYPKSNFPDANIDDMDMMEWNSIPIKGSDARYKKMIEYINNNDLSNDVYLDTVLQMIDVENFIDYNIAEIFYANCDWPMANMKFWRDGGEGGKWRWILFDTDLGWDKDKIHCAKKGHQNTLLYALGVNNCHLPHLEKSLIQSTVMLRKMVENEKFKNQFVTRFADLMNTVYTPENINSTLMAIKAGIEPEMPHHIARWKASNKGISSMDQWEANISKMVEFGNERADTMRLFIDERFGLGGIGNLTLSVDKGGVIQVNTVVADSFPWTGKYFRKLKVKLVAIPNEGKHFVKWSDGVKSEEREILLEKDMTLTAIFN